MDILLGTKDKIIAEACYNRTWGTGIPLHADECLIKEKWEGIGILGEMLMDIRKDNTNIIGDNRDTTSATCTIGDNG